MLGTGTWTSFKHVRYRHMDFLCAAGGLASIMIMSKHDLNFRTVIK